LKIKDVSGTLTLPIPLQKVYGEFVPNIKQKVTSSGQNRVVCNYESIPPDEAVIAVRKWVDANKQVDGRSLNWPGEDVLAAMIRIAMYLNVYGGGRRIIRRRKKKSSARTGIKKWEQK
jgi:hypothetical protein